MYTIIYGGCDEVFSSEFLDDIDEWFDENDPDRTTYTVEFESLED